MLRLLKFKCFLYVVLLNVVRNEQSATLSAQLSTKWLNFNWGRRHHPDGDVPV